MTRFYCPGCTGPLQLPDDAQAVIDAARAWAAAWDYQHSGATGRALLDAVRALDGGDRA